MYTLEVLTAAIVNWDELIAHEPRAEQPTMLQIVRCDIQAAMPRLSLAELFHMAGLLLNHPLDSAARADYLEWKAPVIAAILLPVVNGKGAGVGR